MVYLIDASVYIFRAWFSMPPDLRDAEGNPTHAVYGFARFVGDLIERRQPRYLAVAFDESHGHGHRHALFPAYKANREPAPLELKRQFALCREIVDAMGIAAIKPLAFRITHRHKKRPMPPLRAVDRPEVAALIQKWLAGKGFVD